MSFQLLGPAASTGAKLVKQNKLSKIILQNIDLQLAADNSLQNLHKLNGVFSKHKIDRTHIKSQLKELLKKQQSIHVSIKNISDSKLSELITDFKKIDVQATLSQATQVPQFPTQIQHIDLLQTQLIPLEYQEGMNNIPFTDLVYRKRRDYIAQIAMNFRIGDKIPQIDYTDQQNSLWVRLFEKLRFYHKGTMCSKFQQKMETLNKHFKMYQKMPQLQDLSMYLKKHSGFTIKPAHGIINQRAFFNALAFKVFNCTQYLRHSSTMDYTPEPDIVHQIVGHVPMFADPAVADFSQKIGLISLGVSDQDISKLGQLYLYTIQFGVYKEANGKNKAFGAGIAGSIGEIQHFNSKDARFKPFEPHIDCDIPCPLSRYQDTYRVTGSFSKACEDLQQFGNSFLSPITTTFNKVTQKVQYKEHTYAIINQSRSSQL